MHFNLIKCTAYKHLILVHLAIVHKAIYNRLWTVLYNMASCKKSHDPFFYYNCATCILVTLRCTSRLSKENEKREKCVVVDLRTINRLYFAREFMSKYFSTPFICYSENSEFVSLHL